MKRYEKTLDEFRALLELLKKQFSYKHLEDEMGVNRYYLWKILNDETYRPTPRISHILGIKLYREAPVCSKCGEVHVTKICTKNRKPRTNWRGDADQGFERLLRYLPPSPTKGKCHNHPPAR